MSFGLFTSMIEPLKRRRRALRRTLALALLPAMTLVGSAAVPGAETNDATGREYASFKIITDRNIFNASRSRRSRGGSGEDRKPNKVDTLTLVGTLSYEKGPYAFFDGSSSEYKKVLPPGGTIAGYKLTEMAGSSVKLESGTNTVELRVGMQLRREEEGDWQVIDSSAKPAPAGSTAASESANSSSGADESDIIKRLMQQREQELK